MACGECYNDKDGIAAYCIGETNIEPFGKRTWLCPDCSQNTRNKSEEESNVSN